MRTIDWYLAKSDNERQIALAELTHEFMMTALPRIIVERKWHLPYYSYIKMLGYMNLYKDHLYLSFNNGPLLDHPMLEKASTKNFAKYYIKCEDDLYSDALMEIILAAAALQEELYKK